MIVHLGHVGRVVADDGDDYRSRLLRQRRTELLAASDWTQADDAPLTDEQKAAWQTYRQQLRDLPSTLPTPPPATVTFPDPPG